MYAATGSRWKALGLATASGLSEPLGALAALLLVKPFLTEARLHYILVRGGVRAVLRACLGSGGGGERAAVRTSTPGPCGCSAATAGMRHVAPPGSSGPATCPPHLAPAPPPAAPRRALCRALWAA